MNQLDQSRVYFFKHNGDEICPIVNGDYYTNEMSEYYYNGHCFLQFFDANLEPVTPTGGTVVFRSAVMPEQYLQDGLKTVINAVDVAVGDASYDVPQFNSAVVKSKMTLVGITGAVYVKAMHWRHR